ncbi:MAG: SCP2 sterol-binding domain-containing protein [Spirochaetales bacterium]|nr:SCP2 sterol-binding domain-containing protein [Spirochaetales bacterium]
MGNLQDRIEEMRNRTTAWLHSMMLKEKGYGIFTNSDYNKELQLGDMYFPATYNAGHGMKLLGEYENITDKEKDSIASFLNGFQRTDGVFRMKGMKEEDLTYPDFEYDDFHQTNYAMGLLDSLDRECAEPFRFMKKYDSRRKLDSWLRRRDMRAPWTEGNFVVNLASFYIRMMEKGNKSEQRRYKKLLDRLLLWHEVMQDPETGYWIEKGFDDPVSGMAGASHNFHIYFYLNRPVPRYKKIIDHSLSILNDGVSSACLDIDVVDVLCNFYKYRYRQDDIRNYLEKKLKDLLDYQNEDGGFSDTDKGIRYFDGWSVYREPQGMSNCFATWFRCAAIAMIDCTLHPENSEKWHFRKGIGMGYFNKDYMKEGFSEEMLNTSPKVKHIKAWIPKTAGKKEMKLNDDSGQSKEEIRAVLLEKMNEADLSEFKEEKIFAFRVKDEDGYFALAVSSDGVEAVPYSDDSAHVLLTISIGNLMKIAQGKMQPVFAYGTKKLKISGDITLALKLQNLI